MTEVIKKILQGSDQDIETVYEYAKSRLIFEGPTSVSVLEIFTYLAKFRQDFFKNKIHEVLNFMGLFYKNTTQNSLHETVFKLFSEAISEVDSYSYTPVQSNIVHKINENQNFSFSAPTSTGKSFIFNNIIKNSKKDVVVIVPSRALINEYFIKLCEAIPDKTTNILTSVNIINTKHSFRNIFILTPERAKELFKFKLALNIEFFLFDEAQLSDDKSFRGLFFDSIVRRIKTNFPSSQCIFSHPFVKNPEAQIKKNNLNLSTSAFQVYRQKNIGQMFYTHDDGNFSHFGIEKETMGKQSIKSSIDPIQECLENNGSILVYTSKASIYNKEIFSKFDKYIKACAKINDEYALNIISQLREIIGASSSQSGEFRSNMIGMLKKGVVTHHGSLPLKARILLEEFTQNGFCRICFATSTLEQGINMPFDIVHLERLESSKPLAIKNLIGRAGRSTEKVCFDFGAIIVPKSRMSAFRKAILSEQWLSDVSQLESTFPDDDDAIFKESIRKNDFSDEFNLPNVTIQLLNKADIEDDIAVILEYSFKQHIENAIQKLLNAFVNIYEHYLDRELSEGEDSIFREAMYLFLLRLRGKTFQKICQYRYQKARKADILKQYLDSSQKGAVSRLKAGIIQGYANIPNKNCRFFSVYPKGTKAIDVDYDRIVFDTYDYFDKLINFRLSDIFYAIFYNFYIKTNNSVSLKLAMHFKYGSDNDDVIMLKKYGLSTDEIDEFMPYIESVTPEELIVKPEIYELPAEKLTYIKRFIYN